MIKYGCARCIIRACATRYASVGALPNLFVRCAYVHQNVEWWRSKMCATKKRWRGATKHKNAILWHCLLASVLNVTSSSKNMWHKPITNASDEKRLLAGYFWSHSIHFVTWRPLTFRQTILPPIQKENGQLEMIRKTFSCSSFRFRYLIKRAFLELCEKTTFFFLLDNLFGKRVED